MFQPLLAFVFLGSTLPIISIDSLRVSTLPGFVFQHAAAAAVVSETGKTFRNLFSSLTLFFSTFLKKFFF